jgi:hypothetical protein
MQRHRHFDLWLHDEEELVPLLHDRVAERVTLHEWPLSCVQRLTTSNGRKVIYKTQFGPTVEPEFYAHARSSLLPTAKTIYRSDGHVCMLLDLIEGPTIEDLSLTEENVVEVGREVTAQIAEIDGQLPHFIDVSTEEQWTALIGAALRDIRHLVEQGKFNLVDATTVRGLEQWAFSESVLTAIRTNPGYVHGDLTADNLFVLQDGYRVVDWQRPMLGPTDLDLATLASSLGFNPSKFVHPDIVRVMHFLQVHWLTQCTTRWIPEATPTYDQQIVRFASSIERSAL